MSEKMNTIDSIVLRKLPPCRPLGRRTAPRLSSLFAAAGAELPPLLSSSCDLSLLYIYLEKISSHSTLGLEVPL